MKAVDPSNRKGRQSLLTKVGPIGSVPALLKEINLVRGAPTNPSPFVACFKGRCCLLLLGSSSLFAMLRDYLLLPLPFSNRYYYFRVYRKCLVVFDRCVSAMEMLQFLCVCVEKFT